MRPYMFLLWIWVISNKRVMNIWRMIAEQHLLCDVRRAQTVKRWYTLDDRLSLSARSLELVVV